MGVHTQTHVDRSTGPHSAKANTKGQAMIGDTDGTS